MSRPTKSDACHVVEAGCQNPPAWAPSLYETACVECYPCGQPVCKSCSVIVLYATSRGWRRVRVGLYCLEHDPVGELLKQEAIYREARIPATADRYAAAAMAFQGSAIFRPIGWRPTVRQRSIRLRRKTRRTVCP